MATVALTLSFVLVIVLLHIEQKRQTEVSIALWVPTFWMLLCASRPVGSWFQFAGTSWSSIESGSPLDRLALSIFIIIALIILLRRKINWSIVLKDNFWVVLMLVYAGISILWSDIPFVSFKRWIKPTGDVLMAFVVLSERRPLQALESILRRCAYVLVPLSLVLIKYFPQWGVAYSAWSGRQAWNGVTLQKNSLGELCALSSFFLIWSFLRDRRSGGLFKARSQTLADALVLAVGVFILCGEGGSYSATSVGSLIVATAISLLLFWREDAARLVVTCSKAFVLSLPLLYLLFRDPMVQVATRILGRDETLTGRTDIWRPLLDFASRNPFFGVGYGGFWAPGNVELESLFSTQFNLTAAHNGYLAVYVELGIVGILLLGVFIMAYCGKVRRVLNHSFEWGVYGICLLSISLICNGAEVSFLQSPNYLWATMVFVAVVFSAPHPDAAYGSAKAAD